MSALIAFTGPPDPELAERFLSRLQHRGSHRKLLSTNFGTVAVCEWKERLDFGQTSTQCTQTEQQTIALSGALFTSLPTPLTSASLTTLRGTFALAWLEKNKLHIVRDPVGTQSLYYARVGGRWCAASEPKAFTREASFTCHLRPASLAQYLSFSFVPGRETMLEGVYEVEAGTMVTLSDDGQPKIERYFRFEEEEPTTDESADLVTSDMGAAERSWVEEARCVVQAAVTERLPTTDTVAATLSGGLDSSLVAAELARQLGGKRVVTYSIHFGKDYPNELPYAAAVAARIGSQHHEVQIQPKNFLPSLRQMIWHLDEPIGDPITQPNYEIARIIGQDFDQVFNGEGGDPLFGGPKNLTMMLHHWYGGVARPANFREQAYLASYRRAYEEWSRLLHPRWRSQINPVEDLEGVLRPFFATDRPRKFLNKLMTINIRLKGANLILPKVDRMMAAHQLTPLSPLFDDRLTRLSFRMPPNLKLRSGVEKFVLKQAYQDLLPQEVIDRPKSGMRVPVHYWFQGEMKRFTAKILSPRSLKQAEIFDTDRVGQLLKYSTEEGPGRYGIRLWMLLTFEIWRRVFIEGEAL